MQIRWIGALLFAGLFVVVGCSSDASSSQTDDLKGGCRMVCPKCHPNEMCPMIACMLDCNGKAHDCVDNQLCPIGYSWSQSKCSCVSDTTCVETQLCVIGDVWDSTLCQCVPQ